MKPLLLHLHNIGPFLDETVDFGALDDMFLITGKTGSGKTTIFDAMTYALYGDVSGSDSIRTGKIRLHSDFAPEEEEGFVEFTFLLNEHTYKVYRTVATSRRTKSGAVRQVTPKMALSALNGRTKEWEEERGTTRELTDRLSRLIGLSKEEFSKVVVLPQGEFAEFLRQPPEERRKTLAKLFPVEFYTSLRTAIENDYKAARRDIDLCEAGLANEQKDYDKDTAVRRLADIDAALAALQERIARHTEELETLAEERTRVNSRLLSAQEAKRLYERRTSLERQKEAVAADEKRIALAQEAIPFAERIQAKNGTARQLAKAQEELSRTKRQALELQDTLRGLEGRRQEVAGKKEELEEGRLRLHDLQIKLDRATQAQKARQELEAAQAQIAALYRSVAPVLSKAEAELASCTAAIAQKEELLLEAERTVEGIKAAAQEEKDNNVAAALAKDLEDGTPCPVCGAVHHPLLARFANSGKDYAVLLQVQQAAVSSITADIRGLSARKEQLATARTVLEQTAAGLQEMAQKEMLPLPVPPSLPVPGTPIPSLAAITGKQRQVRDAILRLAECRTSYESLVQDGAEDAGILLQRRQAEHERIAALEREIGDFENALASGTRSCSEAQGRVLSLENTTASLREECGRQQALLAEALGASGFTDEEDVARAVIESGELSRLQRTCRAYHDSYKDVLTRLETCTARPEETDGLTRQLEAIEGRRLESQRQNDADSARRDSLIKEQADMTNKRKRIEGLAKDLQALRARHAVLTALYTDISNGNPKKIPLDNWVLGTFLADVVDAANLRFRHISGGRYTFVFKTGSGGNGSRGLDLSISDSYTGKIRETESLSGGELFMASLSLALALTDVVQQRSGGIRLDSLFIDEGFGTLDEEILDNTITILNEVQEHRMVGIISHVESLAADIPSHVVVTKTPGGSTISQT